MVDLPLYTQLASIPEGETNHDLLIFGAFGLLNRVSVGSRDKMNDQALMCPISLNSQFPENSKFMFY